MPRVTVYLPDALAEQVKTKDGLNVSAICQSALEKELQRMTMTDELTEGMERIELDMDDRDVAFVGRWLVAPDPDETRAHEEYARNGGQWDAGFYWGVALTAKRRVLVYSAHCNDRGKPRMEVYGEVDDIRDDVPSNIFYAAKEMVGERYVEELDI
jgi:hypothetical protein